ncbi:hypothetical protein VTO73DRAFT_10370 [Trametes versicolor]
MKRLSDGLGRNLAPCPTRLRRKTLFHDRPRTASRLRRSIIALRTLALRSTRAPENHISLRFDFSHRQRACLHHAVAPHAIPCVKADAAPAVVVERAAPLSACSE